ncbi:hypothetical protein GWI33_007655 [Rhynchophorus ferrugineus]|uniref:Uncharacterized protein n=1 Tax=Rhynchophorus ferrugineus TaxID=354439 RepID=A0A834MI30_RHYFE|nr:hypothetical protein GWI33_007655 [Rhynchophorus ferrugineus]
MQRMLPKKPSREIDLLSLSPLGSSELSKKMDIWRLQAACDKIIGWAKQWRIKPNEIKYVLKKPWQQYNE